MSDQTFKVGEKEYSLEELQGKIEKGEYAEEMEKTYNTDFKSAWSAYGKSQQENKELREKVAGLEKPKEESVNLSETNIDEVFKEKGFITKEEAERIAEEKFAYKEQVGNIVGQFKSLESDLNGEDGRPKFEADKVLKYMEENQLLDPKKAYDMMHFDEITNWKAEQLSKKPGFAQANTKETASSKKPESVSYDRNNVDAALREALGEASGKF